MKLKFLALLALLISFNAFAWNQLPGAARDVGDGWVIGTDAATGGFGIYRWDESHWTKMPGAAIRIGGTYSNPWVVNSSNQIFRWTGSSWQQMPGAARDVADGWVIGTDVASGGFGIYRWNGSSWSKMPGAAVRIGGTYNSPWVINNLNQIFRWNGSNWQQVPGAGRDVGDGWVIGTNAANGGFGIFRWNGSSWSQVSGAAVSIGGAGGPPWVINNASQIFRW